MPPPPQRKLKVVGMDPSLRNWGLASATFHVNTGEITISSLSSIHPVLPTGKQVRQNSLDLESALQLAKVAYAFISDANAVFVEVPVGSQSARAMASYGICVGVLGALRTMSVPFFELTPTEVKLAGPGIKTASKKQMIEWAMATHPDADWPTYMEHGEQRVSEAKAEHMADAVAAIHAGVALNQFQQMLHLAA